MNEPTLCMNVWGGRGGDQLVFATKEIRTPKATSNKSTLSDPPPKKKIRKIKEEFMKENNTKQRIITTPFLNFEQMIKGSVRMKGNKEATTLILLYFGSLLQ